MTVRAPRGFTLVELIITLVLLAIISVSFGAFIVPALRANDALRQRAAPVDSAESALRRMARDIRIAVPNSVQISTTASGFTLELVPSVDGARYCAGALADCVGASQLLDFSAADNNFDVLGLFQDTTFVNAAILGTSAYRLVIGNTGAEVYTAGGAPAVITPAPTSITLTTVGGRHHVALGAAHQFSASSPRQRVFVVRSADAPVRYVCDITSGTLVRFAGYTFGGSPSGGGVLMASHVTSCAISSTTNDVLLAGIVLLTLGLTNAGESVSLMHQAQLDNSS